MLPRPSGIPLGMRALAPCSPEPRRPPPPSLPLTVYPALSHSPELSPVEGVSPKPGYQQRLTLLSLQDTSTGSLVVFHSEMAPNSGSLLENPHQSSKLFSVTEVEPWLYLSGASVLGARLLEDLSISTVVSACPELPPLPLPESVTLHHLVDIRDTPQADIAPHLATVADIIAKTAAEGGRTLVHCVAGVSRSASLCLAYLVRERGLTLESAYLRLLQLRPCIRPNFGFFNQLIDFERELTGSETVHVSYNPGAKAFIPNVYEPEYLNTVRYIHRAVGIK